MDIVAIIQHKHHLNEMRFRNTPIDVNIKYIRGFGGGAKVISRITDRGGGGGLGTVTVTVLGGFCAGLVGGR